MVRLIRHGQASLGAADYDQLSARGFEQCRRLGRHAAEAGWKPQALWRGSLRRHAQSLQAFGQGWVEAGGAALPAATVAPSLDEYDSHALLQALMGPQPLPQPATREGYRAHFLRLRQALEAWMQGRIAPAGMPSHAAFHQGVAEVLGRLHAQAADGDALVFSSGGPISTAVGQVLSLGAPAVVELNMRLRNSALCELVSTRSGFALLSFNALPHLHEGRDLEHITHA